MISEILGFLVTKGLDLLFDIISDKTGKATDKRGLRKRVEEYSLRFFQDNYAHVPMSEAFDYQGLHDFLMSELSKGVAACFDAPSHKECIFSRDQLVKRAFAAAKADTEDKKRGAEAYVSLVLGIIETHFLEQCGGKLLFLANRQTAEIHESVASMLNNVEAELEVFLYRHGSFAEFIDSIRAPEVRMMDYHYLNPRIGFVRRDKEFDYLDSFLDAPEGLLSLAITGPGGIGKSKLMHQYMLERKYDSEWKSVFLEQFHIQKLCDYTDWRYPKNLMLIMDYAGACARTIGQWIRGIFCSTNRPEKLRIILLERQGLMKLGGEQTIEPLWYQQLTDASGPAAKEIQYQDGFHPLPVMTKCEMFDMIDMVSENRQLVTITQKETICQKAASFAKDDKEHRFNTPLFAILLTDALIHNEPLVRLNAKTLMKYVIKRTRDSWRNALCHDEPSLFDSLERLAVYATATGGWNLRLLPSPLETDTTIILNKFTADALRMLSATIAGDDSEHEELAPLQPDIIGEYFVLDYLHQHRNSTYYCQMIELFWQKPIEFSTFLNRCVRSYLKDFPVLVFGKFSLLSDASDPDLRSMLLENMTTLSNPSIVKQAVADLELLYEKQ